MLEVKYPTTNFFTKDFMMKDSYFFLTDGDKDSGNVSRVKEIGICIDIDNLKVEILIIKPLYPSFSFVLSEFDLDEDGIRTLSDFLDEVKEWFGLTQTWRRISAKGKKLTLCVIKDGVCKTDIKEMM